MKELSQRKVSEIMTTRVVTLGMDDSVRDIREIFERVRFHHIMVMNGSKLAGVISDRDLLKQLSPFLGTGVETGRDVSTLNRRVHQIMTRAPVTVFPDQSLETAATLLLQKNVSCLPVVARADGAVVGVLSWKDILRHLVLVD